MTANVSPLNCNNIDLSYFRGIDNFHSTAARLVSSLSGIDDPRGDHLKLPQKIVAKNESQIERQSDGTRKRSDQAKSQLSQFGLINRGPDDFRENHRHSTIVPQTEDDNQDFEKMARHATQEIDLK